MKRVKLVIVDYGSQYTFLLARRLRSSNGGGVLCEIISPSQLENVNESNCAGVILSGGPQTVTNVNDDEMRIIQDPNLPVLGVCYGMQLLGKAFGGDVKAAPKGEFGPMSIRVIDPRDELLSGVAVERVWMSHGDEVKISDEFMSNAKITALSDSHCIAGLRSEKFKCWGVQFHPEVSHTDGGNQMLFNFVTKCCGLKPNTWTDVEQLVSCKNCIIETVDQDDRVILGLSGGVDSAVVAALLSHVLPPDQWLAVYVDHGMMRAGETEAVKKFAHSFGIPFKHIDCSDKFLSELQGIIDPEHKRKIIGRLFIEAFTEAARDFGPTILAQGTIYPDVVESARSSANQHLIKSHHNVGGLPADLGLELLEPLKWLFKDEVRAIGARLKLPEHIVNRPPFPGPGLGIRIIGQSVTADKILVVQHADAIFHECIRAAKLPPPSQSYAALLPGLSVGVVGDQRRHGMIICLRAIQSDDFMTASLYPFGASPIDMLQSVASRIVNECPKVARVVFDITPKPPGTIELE